MIHKPHPDGHFVPLCVDAVEAYRVGLTAFVQGKHWQVTRDDGEVTCVQCIELMADTVAVALVSAHGRERA